MCKKACGFVFLLIAGVVAASVVFVATSDSPRAKVTRDRVMQKIDRMLGETNVARARVEQRIEQLRSVKARLFHARVSAEVKADMLNEDVRNVNDEVVDAREYLVHLREQLEKGNAEIQIDGKAYTQTEADQKAKTAISTYNSLSSRLSTLKRTQETLTDAAKKLRQRENEVLNQILEYENQLQEIDAKLLEVQAMKDAARTLGEVHCDTPHHVRDNTDQEMRELQIKVETVRRMELERWNELAAKEARHDDHAILAEVKGVEATVDRINAALDANK